MGLVLAAIVHACFHLIFLAQGVIFFYSGQLVGTSGRLLSPKPTLPVVRIAAICRLYPLDAVLSSGLCGKEGALPLVTG